MLSLPVEVLSAGLTLSSRLPARGPMIHTVAERKQRSALMRQDGGGGDTAFAGAAQDRWLRPSLQF